MNEEPVLNLIAIKTKKGLYISDNVEKKSSYDFRSKIEACCFDNEKPQSTYDDEWFFIKDNFSKVQRYYPPEKINFRYELKDEYTPNNEIPAIINEGWLDNENKYYKIIGLYERKYDTTEEKYIDVDYTINIIETIDDFEPVKPIYRLQHSVFDRIIYDPFLLPTRPCKLTAEETYSIIRGFINRNIDTDWARITSNYDFCFTVKKIIYLDEPQEYRVDVANINNWNKRKRKSRYETRYKKSREVEIFNMAPKPYSDYKVVKPFEANSYEELVEIIDNTLQELIEEINRPLVDCPNCHGLGVILKEEK